MAKKNKFKLTEKDFEVVKELLKHMKGTEVARLTGWSMATIYNVKRFDTYDEYYSYNVSRLNNKKAPSKKPEANQKDNEIVTVLRELVNEVRGLKEAWLTKPTKRSIF